MPELIDDPSPLVHVALLPICVLLLALVFAAPVGAADKLSDNSKTVRGGLVCLSVDEQHGQSDALCAKAEMVCTGTMSTHSRPIVKGKPSR